MNFSQSLKLAQKNLSEQLSVEVLEALESTKFISSKIIDRSLKIGEIIPDFVLSNQNRELIHIQRLLKKGNLVISFYRGSWCPFCSLELKALEQALPAINSLGGTLVAISPQKFVDSTYNQEELSFEMLVDRRNQVARKFGIVFKIPEELRIYYENIGIYLPRYNGEESFELPIPATFIVNQDGKIHYAFVDSDYSHRLDPVEIVTILRKMAV
ncbi:MAG: peroxiredoxin-like family protein [Cyanobacteria bacterium P01_D01_bin.116]